MWVELLNKEDDVFKEQVSVLEIEDILAYYLDNDTHDAYELELIFRLYERASQLNIQQSVLLSPPVLLRFLLLIGDTNRNTVCDMMSVWTDHLLLLQPLIECIIHTALDKTPKDIQTVYILTHSMDVLLNIVSPYLTLDYTLSIQDSYDHHYVPMLIDRIASDPSLESYGVLIKEALVSSFNALQTLQEDSLDRLLLCIERSGLEEDSRPLIGIDAPLMMDWQYTYHIAQQLPPCLLKISLEQLEDMARIADHPWTVQEDMLTSRKNIYDQDAFDVFSHPINRDHVVMGKKEKVVEADVKKKVMELVDMYEDEYDDSYDSVPISVDVPEEVVPTAHTMDPSIQHESTLIQVLSDTPDVFTHTHRNTPQRTLLKQKTGMTDEQLEGWATMFNRNPRKQKIMEKYTMYTGIQSTLPPKDTHSKSASSKSAPSKSASSKNTPTKNTPTNNTHTNNTPTNNTHTKNTPAKNTSNKARKNAEYRNKRRDKMTINE